MYMKPIEGAEIITYGQKAIITQVVTVNKRRRIYLDSQIVVPTMEYVRDYIDESEIQSYVL
ncbi:MAG: hypothetical protein R6U15_01780 [Candidatus Izemoplasmatales bacterium]